MQHSIMTVGLVVTMALGTVLSQSQIVQVSPGQTALCPRPFVDATQGPTHKHCPTSVPTTTSVPSTATPVPTLTLAAQPNSWHPPTDHEHGDEPPAWVAQFSQATFGHGVIYGGNETTSPMEQSMKHQAFKGVLLKTVAGGDLYWRYHAASNPLDRSSRFHSFEVYVRDTSGGISFFEGWYDSGDPNTARCAGTLDQCTQRPIVISNAPNTEQWYMNHGALDFAVNINGPTTYYGGPAENATAMDQSTWKLTGRLGTERVDSTEVFISYWPERFLAPGRYCAKSDGRYDGVVARGAGCDSAHPMEWVLAPTLGADLRTEYGVDRISTVREAKSYPCPTCTVPN